MATILDIANADRNLHLLIKAIKASGLEDRLKGAGPFTLLAPVDLAFRNMFKPDRFENLMNGSGSSNKLLSLLGYHVLTVKRMLRDFRHGQKYLTVNGQEVMIHIKEGNTFINNAKILARDMQGTNGVIHSIDLVNVPASDPVK